MMKLKTLGVALSLSLAAASAFWPLLTGAKTVVIQNARKREIDNQIFKYVGVAGVDKPRIVQVGVAAANLCK
jgi:adenylate cyclase